MRVGNARIRLHKCAGWFKPLLFKLIFKSPFCVSQLKYFQKLYKQINKRVDNYDFLFSNDLMSCFVDIRLFIYLFILLLFFLLLVFCCKFIIPFESFFLIILIDYRKNKIIQQITRFRRVQKTFAYELALAKFFLLLLLIIYYNKSIFSLSNPFLFLVIK